MSGISSLKVTNKQYPRGTTFKLTYYPTYACNQNTFLEKKQTKTLLTYTVNYVGFWQLSNYIKYADIN